MRRVLARIRRELAMLRLCGELGDLDGEIAALRSYRVRPERVSLLEARRGEVKAAIRELSQS